MASGFTETGFQRNTLSQIILEYQSDIQSAYKNPKFSIEDNENIGQFLKVVAGREDNFWKALEQCYRVWTLNGCEGPFLDEILALQGVFRNPATSGSGDAVVETNSNAIDTTSINVGTIFRGENSGQYATTKTTLVSERVTAYKIIASNIPLTTYNLSVQVLSTGENYTSTFTLASSTAQARLNFIDSIKTFLENIDNSVSVYIDPDNLTLYWGFDEAYDLIGLPNTVRLLTTPSLGNRYSLVECLNTSTGFNPLGLGEIKTMSILPIGYVSVTNIKAFSAGTDVETDAAFIERARSVSDRPSASTRAAIVAGLLANVSGIEKVKFLKVVNPIVTLTPIIIGGTIEDIGKELYRTQPINNQYSGDITYTVNTEDGETEVIQFSRGEEQELVIRVAYSTTSNNELSTSERNTARSNLVNLSESWQLGKKVFNFSLLSAVSSAQEINNFSSLIVEVKKFGQPDSSFSSNDYQPLDVELPQLRSENITFVRTIS